MTLKEIRLEMKQLKDHMINMQSRRVGANRVTLGFLDALEAEHQELFRKLQMKVRLLAPSKLKEGDITTQDILTARSVPISTFVDVPRSRKVLCLFHTDKQPSMHLYQTNYYCFTCQSSGDTISYIMKTRNMPFKEAVLFLVRK